MLAKASTPAESLSAALEVVVAGALEAALEVVVGGALEAALEVVVSAALEVVVSAALEVVVSAALKGVVVSTPILLRFKGNGLVPKNCDDGETEYPRAACCSGIAG